MARPILLAALCLGTAAVCAGTDGGGSDPYHRKHIRFHFFNKDNAHTEKGYQIQQDLDAKDVLKSGFKPENETKMLIPGYNSGITDEPSQLLKDAYFRAADADLNLIVVDWSDLKLGLDNVQKVARRNAELLDFMVQRGLLKLDALHIIGLSVASHVAGVTGERVREGRIKRITGLDPSRPFITLITKQGRLSDDDADLVDVIHTNAGTLGEQPAIGHVDFYVNGGKKQPGCKFEFLGSCSHMRAFRLWGESIGRPDTFRAWRCEDEWAALHQRCESSDVLANMGEHLSFSCQGSYFLETNAASPFSLET